MGLALLLFSCGHSKFKIQENKHGISVDMGDMILDIQVLDESIVHVQKYLPNTSAEAKPDYVTVLKAADVAVPFKVRESKGEIKLSTESVAVMITDDGNIEYQDAEGKYLVAETNDLTYVKPGAEREVSQAFVAGDEALYGLGQYQSNILNWRGQSNRMEQFNQEIVVPFLMSTNQYGIYWHNYSVTDFNEPQHEIEFDKEKMLAFVKKQDQDLGQDAENVIKHKIEENKERNIRVTTFTPKKTGAYSFMIESDKSERMRGEIRLLIDQDTVINYKTIWVPTTHSGSKVLQAGKEYEVVLQNTGSRKMAGRLLYNEPDFNKTVFSSKKGSAIDYYFVHGKNPQQVLAKYQQLTGKSPMFAKKSYGFWQCRERYHDQEELLTNARALRKRQIPVDNIVQDWFYWPKGTKGPEWDRAKYPNPKAMADELEGLNMNLMVSVWPMVNNDPLLKKYNLLGNKMGERNHNLDFYDQGVRDRYYKMLSDSMFHFGVKSIWLDGTEPASPPSADAMTAIGQFDEVSNAYSLVVNKAMYEGKRKEYPNERVFNLTRSAYAGQQRFGATSWSGDVQATWEQFAEQIPAGLNFTMAGIPYWTHDIGGFFRDSKSMNPIYDSQYTNPEFIELLTRWFQFGAFSPIFRIHGYVSETEIWRYDQAFENTARKFIDLRYKLMPYIYSEAWKVTKNSHSLMSPLAYYYPNDKKTWDIKDQLFFGESMMVAFVTNYQQRSKTVYLPEGKWFDYWTNEQMQGNKSVEVNAPLDETPIFVKAGTILPTGPKVQYATQPTDEPMTIRIYPGKDAQYVLYLDDNESNDYEKGKYSEIEFSYNDQQNTLSINKGNDQYLNLTANPIKLKIEKVGGSAQQLMFNGQKTQVTL
ncbi:TIM-barrel domain-containing protein [Persicobacter psychrovividus]|uniref:glycoside hydrolase family 31 protein n=1 Tax=Persicobacter psychrovividus TaxID=387638 RepID=UPI0030CA593B